jgi:hypothetical protein
MIKPLVIGDKTFKYKKDAVIYYREILNKYNFEESLNDLDFNDLIDLLNYDYSFYENEDDFSEDENLEDTQTFEGQIKLDLDEKIEQSDIRIIDIKVTRFDYNHKCFKLIYNDLYTCIFSYLAIINRPKENPDRLFNIACRDIIRKDIFNLKQKYFNENYKNGFVKCQESKMLSKWEDLVIDHRQPNTFSVIVDRFKEIYKINVLEMEYVETDDNRLIFKDEKLNQAFQSYHKEKANLRIVRKELNSSRASMGRIKRTSKDLKIE